MTNGRERSPDNAPVEVLEPARKGRAPAEGASAPRAVLVTGATGYIGRHTVRALLEQGFPVRALCRGRADELVAEGAEVVRGDVLDTESLARAMRGADAVIHGAGLVSRSDTDRAAMWRVHVEGTRFVMAAAIEAGVRRVVHLSTSGVVALSDDKAMVCHEDDPVPLPLLSRYPYYLSKFMAERAAADALRLTQAATELVTLNPSLVLGPGDVRGSSTLDVQRFLRRELPVVPSGGFSFVDVRDVADLAVTALTRARPGQRYLLGAINLTFAEFFQRLEQVSGVRGPPVPVALPGALSRFAVGALEKIADSVGAKLPVSSVEAEMASRYWYVDARKAMDELGFAPRDPMQTLLDTVRDIRGQGTRTRWVDAHLAAPGASGELADAGLHRIP